MHTPASVRGHPLHPMLVPIAIGCWVFSFVADLIFLAIGARDPWNLLAYYTMLGGIVGALLAALPGLVDMLSLPSGGIKRTALTHMGINLTVVAMFAYNAWLRHASPESLTLPIALSAVAIVMLLVSGWLGGKMVFEGAVGVHGPGDGTHA
jgi:uncharacterized membrane protein